MRNKELRAGIAKMSIGQKCRLLATLAEDVRAGRGSAENIEIGEIVRGFLDYLNYERGRAVNTQLAYKWDLNVFMGFCKCRGVGDWPAISLELISEFVVAQRKKGSTAATVNRKIACIKSLVNYAKFRGHTYDDRVLEISSLKVSQRLRTNFTPDEIAALIEAAGKVNNARNKYLRLDLRDKAIISFLFSTGCRVAEAANMKIGDVDFAEGQAIITGKGDKMRIVYLHADCVKAMQEYFAKSRPNLVVPPPPVDKPNRKPHRKQRLRSKPIPGGDYFFLSRAGVHLGTREFRRIIKKAGDFVGYKDLSPHTLRHSFATSCYEEGMSIFDVSALLGHSKISTTQIYAAHSPKRLKRIFREFHPHRQKTNVDRPAEKPDSEIGKTL